MDDTKKCVALRKVMLTGGLLWEITFAHCYYHYSCKNWAYNVHLPRISERAYANIQKKEGNPRLKRVDGKSAHFYLSFSILTIWRSINDGSPTTITTTAVYALLRACMWELLWWLKIKAMCEVFLLLSERFCSIFFLLWSSCESLGSMVAQTLWC